MTRCVLYCTYASKDVRLLGDVSERDAEWRSDTTHLIHALDTLVFPSLGTGYTIQRAIREVHRSQVIVHREMTQEGSRALRSIYQGHGAACFPKSLRQHRKVNGSFCARKGFADTNQPAVVMC